MPGKILLLVLLLLPACAGQPQDMGENVQEEKDYSFEAVAARRAEQEAQASVPSRERYKDEIQRCEARGGEWMSPGVCCQWNAFGCVEEKP